jgi:hypothetical protein
LDIIPTDHSTGTKQIIVSQDNIKLASPQLAIQIHNEQRRSLLESKPITRSSDEEESSSDDQIAWFEQIPQQQPPPQHNAIQPRAQDDRNQNIHIQQDPIDDFDDDGVDIIIEPPPVEPQPIAREPQPVVPEPQRVEVQEPRYPQRIRRPPQRLNDYYVNQATAKKPKSKHLVDHHTQQTQQRDPLIKELFKALLDKI